MITDIQPNFLVANLQSSMRRGEGEGRLMLSHRAVCDGTVYLEPFFRP